VRPAPIRRYATLGSIGRIPTHPLGSDDADKQQSIGATAVTSVLALDIAGLHIPDAGPVFMTALAIHIAAGLTATAAGILATTARKRQGRHPRAGITYLYAI